MASLERKIKRQDALISELEAQLERGSAHASAGDDESASDESDDDPASQLGGWDPDDVKQVYEHMLRGRRRFKALVGVGRDDFDKLLLDVRWYIENTTMKGKRKQAKSDSDEWRLDTKMQLFVGLYWLRRYPTLEELSALMRLPVMYAKKVVTRIVHALAEAAEAMPRAKGGLAWPTRAELEVIRAEQARVVVPGIKADFAIDGMHIKIKKPHGVDAEGLKAYWNGKHKCWCLMVILVTDLRGRPVYVSDPLPGGEWRVVLDLEIKRKCADIDASIVGDALYSFNRASDNRRDDIKSYFTLGPTTVTRLRAIAADEGIDANWREWARDELRSTKAASRVRVVVENAILRARSEKALTRDVPFRHYVADPNSRPTYYIDIKAVVRAGMLIATRSMLEKPPRSANWQPEQDATYGYRDSPLNAKNVEWRVREVFNELKPKKSGDISAADDDEDDAADAHADKRSRRRDARAPNSVHDWSEYEEAGDFLVVPQRPTTARQIAKATGGSCAERVRAPYDALDVAEKGRRRRSVHD